MNFPIDKRNRWKPSISTVMIDVILYPRLFALFMNMSFNKNLINNEIHHGGEFYSDKGGYYIYLPATFIYGFHASAYPDSLDYKNGRGFEINNEKDVVFTKYTYGVSILVLPFFLASHFSAKLFNLQADGFSLIYHRMAIIACVFYLILSMFILNLFFSYLFSSWQTWYFGGSFGCRVMVEFYALFALALGYFILDLYQRKNLFLKITPFIILTLVICFNVRLFDNGLSYSGGTWSWEEYKDQLRNAGLVNFNRTDYIYRNDFENLSMNFGFHPTLRRVRSGNVAAFVTGDIPSSCNYLRRLNTILDTKAVTGVSAGIWINPVDTDKTGSYFIGDIEDVHRNLIWRFQSNIDDYLVKANKWEEVKLVFNIPPGIDSNNFIRFYILNAGKTKFYIDDMVIRFE